MMGYFLLIFTYLFISFSMFVDRVLSESFQHRRKMLRQSLKELLKGSDCLVTELPEKWATKRPEQLSPEQFIELTRDIYGVLSAPSTAPEAQNLGADDKENFTSQKVWRAVRM